MSACELVARCKECRRVILLRVVGDAEGVPSKQAKAVFSSLQCFCEKDYERWGTFGLDVKIPARFDLEHSSLKAGVCELVFSDRKAELHITRVSLGRAILGKQKMVPWYEKLAPAFLKPFAMEWTESRHRGHIGYAGSGEPRSNRRLIGFFKSKRLVAVRLFFCDVSDKIFAVAADGLGDIDELVEEVRGGIVCHG